jgi:hypothetical protein
MDRSPEGNLPKSAADFALHQLLLLGGELQIRHGWNPCRARNFSSRYARRGRPRWNSRETDVMLTFEPEEVGYDPAEKLMRFCAADGPFPVRCGIAAEVLAALQDDASPGVESMLATYLRRKTLFQNILAQKYSAGLLERDGRVVVHLADLRVPPVASPIDRGPWRVTPG